MSISCNQKNCNILTDHEEFQEETASHDLSEIELDIIHLLWRLNISKKHYINALVREVRNTSMRKVSIALQSLVVRGFISLKGSQVQLEINKITEVKDLVQKLDGKV